MLSPEDNERVTRTGPGTPCGSLLRSYWQPVALTEELSPERPGKAVRLLGEDLFLYCDADNEYGLIGRWCSHRGVDLSYGRLEDGGVRCLYHGWLYDREGRCLEQPAEPASSRFGEKIDHPAYPAIERNGIVFAYLGGGDPPPLPCTDCFAAPAAYTFAFKNLWDCNWLQGLEGGIDPSHVSFLHRFLKDDPRDTYGQQFRDEVEGTGRSLSALVGESSRPTIDVEPTETGLRVFAIRDLEKKRRHVRITNLLFPNAFVIPFNNQMAITQWHVPVDNITHHWYMMMYDFAEPTDTEVLREQRMASTQLPDYRPVRNRSNQWGFNAEEQQSATYTGMGLDINVHDQWAVESMGPIQDRSRERLGTSDRAVTAYRRQLLRGIENHEAGKPTLNRADGALKAGGPVTVDMIANDDDWEDQWRAKDRARREASPWATANLARPDPR